jgi:hypothetical protein
MISGHGCKSGLQKRLTRHRGPNEEGKSRRDQCRARDPAQMESGAPGAEASAPIDLAPLLSISSAEPKFLFQITRAGHRPGRGDSVIGAERMNDRLVAQNDEPLGDAIGELDIARHLLFRIEEADRLEGSTRHHDR